MRLMAGLRSARTRILPCFLFVGRGRLRRRARVLRGALEPKHQFDQLLLAEPLQITPIHPAMDSEIASLGKGVGNCAVKNLAHSVSLHSVDKIAPSNPG